MTRSKKYEALLVISTAFLVIYLIGFLKHGHSRELYLYLACGIGLTGILIRPLGDLIARAWYKLADLLSLIMSKLIMTLVYLFVLIPVAGLSRIYKKDRLGLRKNEESGWVSRNHRYNSDDLKNIW